jgi:hypothetical protein
VNKRLFISLGLAVVIFLSALLGFVIIPNAVNAFRGVKDWPSDRGRVSGNGGSAVMVGNYLYFANGYVSAQSIREGNDGRGDQSINRFGTAREGAIYRVKMAQDGLPTYNFAAYGADRIDEELSTWVNDLELVVPKVAGFERSAMWVFGDYLIYTSPHNNRAPDGALRTDYLDFFRVDLRGRGNRLLFTAPSARDYSVARMNDGKIYLLVHNGDSLVRVNVCTRPGRELEISERAVSVALPKVSGYYNDSEHGNVERMFSGNMEFVYYTEEREEDCLFKDRGDILKRFNIRTGTKAEDSQELRRAEHAGAGDHDFNHRVHGLSDGIVIFEIGNAHFDELHSRIYTMQTTSFSERTLLTDMMMGETFYVPTSRSGNAPAQIVAEVGGMLFRYVREGAGWVSNRIGDVGDVQDIIEVTASAIYYWNGSVIAMINFAGDRVGTAVSSQMQEGTNSTFSIFHAFGVGEMAFYINFETQKDDEGDDRITFGVMNSFGKEFILTQLDEKFVAEKD